MKILIQVLFCACTFGSLIALQTSNSSAPFLNLAKSCNYSNSQIQVADFSGIGASKTHAQNLQDFSCIDCVNGVLIIDNNTEFFGDITMKGETMSWDLDNTSVHFWGINSTVEFAGRESNIQFTQPQGQIIFAMDSCKVRFDGNQSVMELSGTSFIHYKNNSTGSGSASLGSNSPAITLNSPYTWLKLKSADGSTVYVPAWK